MRIAIVTQYFPPDKPGRIADELSQELTRRGHSVRVVTTYPHYDTGKTPSDVRQRVRHVESRGGVRVRRVPIFASHSRNAVARIANYLSFAWSARLAGSFVKDADAIYVHGTPATTSHPAHVWSRKYGIPYLYHVQDIWPESVTGSGFLPARVGRFADRAISRWLRRVYRDASAVVAIAPSAQKLLVRRGAAEDRVHLVYNWARDSDRVADKRRPVSGPGLTLLYAGNLGALQDLETVVRAMTHTADLADLRLLIAGTGVMEDQLKALTVELELNDRIEFLGRVNPDDIVDVYARADFQIVSLKQLDIFGGTIPSKFQAGLAHRLPVVTTVAGDVSDIVKANQLGFAAAPEDVDALAAAYRRAYETTPDERNEFRARAGAFYQAHLTKQQAVSEIESILGSFEKMRDRGGKDEE